MVYSLKVGKRDALLGGNLDATGGIISSQRKFALFTTERQRALRSAKAFSKNSFKQRSV
jgi:hypothetical protein